MDTSRVMVSCLTKIKTWGEECESRLRRKYALTFAYLSLAETVSLSRCPKWEVATGVDSANCAAQSPNSLLRLGRLLLVFMVGRWQCL